MHQAVEQGAGRRLDGPCRACCATAYRRCSGAAMDWQGVVGEAYRIELDVSLAGPWTLVRVVPCCVSQSAWSSTSWTPRWATVQQQA